MRAAFRREAEERLASVLDLRAAMAEGKFFEAYVYRLKQRLKD